MRTVYNIATIPNLILFTLSSDIIHRFSSKDTLGQRLRKIRKINNLSSKEVGQSIGLTAAGIISIENDVAYPSYTVLKKLLNIFGNKLACDNYSRFILHFEKESLYAWRIANKLTVIESANYVGISEKTYKNLEKDSYISRLTFNKICNKLKIIQLSIKKEP